MKWEFDILYALQKIHQPVLDHIMTGLSTIGNAGIFWIVLGMVLCIPKKYRKIGIQMVISMAITFIIGKSDPEKSDRKTKTLLAGYADCPAHKKPKGLFLSVRAFHERICCIHRTFM